LYKRPQITAVE